tara:strand:+ start:146 stop:976 length:831 start_codon:yes stop_codon:yes gene_type:complete
MAQDVSLPKTLTYDHDKRVMGWPSFYSYHPDWMVGMNNFFYTFYRGRLYKHNSNLNRNRFYGVDNYASITTVFNDGTLDNKIFKTIALQGTNPWTATITSDIQYTGTIEDTWFEKKEGVWFAFVRNTGKVPAADANYALRSVNGIANSTSMDASTPSAVLVNYDVNAQVSGIISIGDLLYYGTIPTPPANLTPILCGKVTGINVDLRAGVNQLVVDTTITGGALPTAQILYYLYVKDSIAESHGVLGHFAKVTLTNTSDTQMELFVVQTDAMKSFP